MTITELFIYALSTIYGFFSYSIAKFAVIAYRRWKAKREKMNPRLTADDFALRAFKTMVSKKSK